MAQGADLDKGDGLSQQVEKANEFVRKSSSPASPKMNKKLLDGFDCGQDGGMSARVQRESNDVNDVNLEKLLINDVNDESKQDPEHHEDQEG